MKKTIYYLFILLFIGFTQAQRPNRKPPSQKKGVLIGTIINQKKELINYATITLEKKDKEVNGAISNEKGQFRIDNISPGVYDLIIETVSMDEKIIENIQFDANKSFHNLGKIEIQVENIIKEVVFQGQKKFIEQKADRQVLNVKELIGSESMTASEILDNSPSIEVSSDGAISLRGSSNITILVDGKPINAEMDSGSILDQYPADVIEKIEVITNPSVKYDPENSGGIINLVLKRKEIEGFNGGISLGIASLPSYNGSANINYRKNKWNLRASYFYKGKDSENTSSYTKDNFDSNIINYSQKGDGKRSFQMANLGADYFINDFHKISSDFRFFNFNSNPLNHVKYSSDFRDSSIEDTYYTEKNENKFDGKNYSLSLNYEWKFHKPDHFIDFSTKISRFDLTNTTKGETTYTDALFNPLENSDVLFNNFDFLVGNNKANYTIAYENPLSSTLKLEAGVQIDNTKSSSDFFQKDIIDSYVFKRNINSTYAILNKELKKTSIKLGFRGEFVYTDVDFKNSSQPGVFESNTVNSKDFNLYPSLSILHKWNESTQFKLNYNRRVRRPDGRKLNPFKRNTNENNQTVGNPYLKSSFTNLYEVGVVKDLNGKRGSLGLNVFFKDAKNSIQNIQYFEDIVNETGQITGERNINTYANVGSEQNYGTELTLQYKLYNWWRLNGGITYYYSTLSGTELENISNDGSNWGVKLNQQFQLGNNWSAQLSNRYRGQKVQINSTQKAFFVSNVSILKKFWKRKASLSLNFQDIFDQRKRAYQENTDQYYRVGENKRESQYIGLNFSYRFGNMKSNRGKKRGTKNRDDSDQQEDMGDY